MLTYVMKVNGLLLKKKMYNISKLRIEGRFE